MKVRFGIMGPGKIARKFANAVALCDDATLYGVASRDAQRAKDFADEYGAEVSYGSYEELVKDENVDIVYISVIHTYHIELAKLAVEHGKAVICEKPLSIDLADCKELMDLAKEKNVLVMEALWSRFLPSYLAAKKWIADGKIGEPKLFSATFSFHAQFDPDSRLLNPEKAGGGLYDVGCYAISAALDFCGGKKPLITKGVAKYGVTGVDEVAAAVMIYENGMVSNISFGVGVATTHDAFVYGTDGKVVLRHFWGCEKAELYSEKGELLEVSEIPAPNGFVFEVQHMCDLFKAGKTDSDVMSKQNSIDNMIVIDTLKQSFTEDNEDLSDVLKLDM